MKFFIESHDSIKSVVPNLGVEGLPKSRKINLRGHRIINGTAKKKLYLLEVL